MPTNPFYFNQPTRPEDFLGRRPQVQAIADNLYAWNGDSYAIIGGRRIGKSSLLLALKDILLKRMKYEIDVDLHVLPIFVSLKAMAQPTSPKDVLGFIIHRIRLTVQHLNQSEPILQHVATNPIPATLQELEATIADVVNTAAPILGQIRLALLLDEMDSIVEYDWTDTLLGNLRALIYDSDVHDTVRLVLSGAELFLKVTERGSPLFNVLNSYYLGALDDASVLELLERAQYLPSLAAAEIIRQGGGHPFILQFILYHLFFQDFTKVTAEHVQNEVRHFTHDRGVDLESCWQHIGIEGQHAYCILRQANDWMTLENVVLAAQNPQLSIDRGLKALCYHGIVIHDGFYARYRVCGQLFRDWVGMKCDASIAKTERIQIDAVIMKGGGVKGLAYAGAMRELEKYYDFAGFVGTSAGSIAAVLLAAGYDGRDLEDILRKTNFRNFMDGKGFSMILNLFIHKGLHPGTTIQEWIRNLLYARTGRTGDIPLKDFAPKRVVIYASRSNGGTVPFDSEGQRQDTPAFFAVRCSMSIPYFFQPQMLEGSRVLDGGLLNNYPVKTYLEEEHKRHPAQRPKFIALYLGSKNPRPLPKGLLLFDMLNILFDRDDLTVIDEYREHTLVIDPSPITTVDFTLSDAEKDLLVLQGRVAALQYIQDQGFPDGPSNHEVRQVTEQARETKEKVLKARRRKKVWGYIISILLVCFIIVSSSAVFGWPISQIRLLHRPMGTQRVTKSRQVP